MKIIFAFSKVVRPNQSTRTAATPITTHIETEAFVANPLGGSTVNTAPSTLLISNGYQYHLNKPFSTVLAALSAASTTDSQANLI